MKTLPSGMQTDLDDGATTHCYCYLVVRSDAVRFGFTDHDENLSFGGDTYEAASAVNPTNIDSSAGLAVDNMEAMGALQSEGITEADIAAGLFDDADITVYRVDWSNVTKRVIVLKGSLGQILRSRIHYKAEIRSLAHRLNQPDGRLYAKLCDADLGDTRCGKDLTAFRVSSAVSATVDRRVFIASTVAMLAKDDDFFSNGKVLWTSGNNDTFPMEVKTHLKSNGIVTISMWEPMPYAIQVGDGFTITAGCDKTNITCFRKFDNIVNHRGFPFVPGIDMLLRIARHTKTAGSGNGGHGGFNQGGSLWSYIFTQAPKPRIV